MTTTTPTLANVTAARERLYAAERAAADAADAARAAERAAVRRGVTERADAGLPALSFRDAADAAHRDAYAVAARRVADVAYRNADAAWAALHAAEVEAKRAVAGDGAAPPAHLVVDTDPWSPAAVVGLDGAVLYGAPARCPTCGGVILLDGPVEGPSAELACAMRACPRRAGSPTCGGRLW